MASVAGFGATDAQAQPRAFDSSNFNARGPGLPPSIAALVEGEIVPRLMAARTPCDCGDVIEFPSAQTAADALLPLTLASDAAPLFDRIDALLAGGVATDALLVDVLPPVARRLGRLWEDDERDFVEVTMGLWRLQQVVHDLSSRRPAPAAEGPRALFAAMPGDQHGFGATIIEEIFRQTGWRTTLLVDIDDDELTATLAAGWQDIAGLTVSQTCHIDRLPSLIRRMRAASFNPDLRIMVGGPAFARDAMLATKVGADGTATDARQALRVAGALVGIDASEAAASG